MRKQGLSVLERSRIKANIDQAFKDVQQSMQQLLEAVRADKDYPIWIYRCPKGRARRTALKNISEFFVSDEVNANETSECHGLVGASPETLRLINEVNKKKDAFKSAMLPLSRRQCMAPDPLDPEVVISTPLARVILRELKLGRLLQRKVTRHIIALPQRPHRVGYSKTEHTPSIKMISLDEARELLYKTADESQLKPQLATLNRLSRNQVLAIVNKASEHVRQNIVFLDKKGKRVAMQKKTSLPLFFPANRGDSVPEHSENMSLPHSRKKRTDVELTSEVLLPSINAYQYVSNVRAEKYQKWKVKQRTKQTA